MKRCFKVVATALVIAMFWKCPHVQAGVNIGNGALTPEIIADCQSGKSSILTCLGFVNAELSAGQGVADGLYGRGDWIGARQKLLESTRAALQLVLLPIPPAPNRSQAIDSKARYALTRDSLTRALDLDQVFTKVCAVVPVASQITTDCRQEQRRAIDFDYIYLKHIKERVIPLDVQYYIPIWTGSYCRPYPVCVANTWPDFAVRYRQSAAASLDLYWGAGYPWSFARDDYELGAGQLIFTSVAEDLARDEFSFVFTFEQGEATRMAKKLAQYQSGAAVFLDDRDAALETRVFARRLTAMIHQKNFEIFRENLVLRFYQP